MRTAGEQVRSSSCPSALPHLCCVSLRVTSGTVLSTSMERWTGRGVIRVFCWRDLQWCVQRERRKTRVAWEPL